MMTLNIYSNSLYDISALKKGSTASGTSCWVGAKLAGVRGCESVFVPEQPVWGPREEGLKGQMVSVAGKQGWSCWAGWPGGE